MGQANGKALSCYFDSLLMYRNEFMEDPDHYHIMVPNDIQI